MECIQSVHGMCMDYVRIICLECVWSMHGICMEYAECVWWHGIFGNVTEHAGSIRMLQRMLKIMLGGMFWECYSECYCRICMEYVLVWSMLWTCMEYAWNVCRIRTKSDMCGICMEYYCNMHGISME